MPKKLEDGIPTVTFQLAMPETWLARVEEWRATQRPVPSKSAAIRQLVDLALAGMAESDPDKTARPKK